jgi:hypothetical protein
LEAIYQRFDSAALNGLKPVNTLWAGNGLVKFDPSSIDTREVALIPVESTNKEDDPDSSEEDEDEDEDEEFTDEEGSEDEEDSEEGSSLSSDESNQIEEPQPPTKRKREEQPSSVRSVKPKKVAFAVGPLKLAKSTRIQGKTKVPNKVGNMKAGSLVNASTGDEEAYDFSKFF